MERCSRPGSRPGTGTRGTGPRRRRARRRQASRAFAVERHRTGGDLVAGCRRAPWRASTCPDPFGPMIAMAPRPRSPRATGREDFRPATAGVEVVDLQHGVSIGRVPLSAGVGFLHADRVPAYISSKGPWSRKIGHPTAPSRRCQQLLRLPPRTPSAVRGTPPCRSRRRSGDPRLPRRCRANGSRTAGLGDLRGRRPRARRARRGASPRCREGVRAALFADQQRIALRYSCAPSALGDGTSAIGFWPRRRDALRHDLRRVRLPRWIILVPVSACWRWLVSATE